MAAVVVRNAIRALKTPTGNELRSSEEVAGGIGVDDRPGVVTEPQKRRHGKHYDKRNNCQVCPT